MSSQHFVVVHVIKYSTKSKEIAKSLLPANFTGWQRVYHRVKLLWKTKIWGNFEVEVEQKSQLA